MSMHSEFSEWFRTAGMEVSGDVLQKRWAGVETVETDRAQIVFLAEVFFDIFDGKESFLAKFKEHFQAHDPAFRMRENNRELSVLAGATLVNIMQRSARQISNFAALALVACAAQNLRGAPCVPEVPELAAKHLSVAAAKRENLDKSSISDDETEASIEKLQREIDIVREESNILWWVFGETSKDTEKRWSAYNVSTTALLAGKELADLTRVLPGHVAVIALLDRVVKLAKSKSQSKVAFKDSIADTPLEWRQKFAKEQCLPNLANLQPLMHAIKLSVDLSAADAWMAALPTCVRIQENTKIHPHLIAYQLFLECLLTNAWGKLT